MVNLRLKRPETPSRRRSIWSLPDIFDDPDFSPFRFKLSEGLDEQSWAPRVDILEKDDSWICRAELPDIKPEDICVTIEEGVLTIKGERKFEEEATEGNFTRVERQYGSFERRFSLPSGIDEENVKFDYKNGVLSLTVAKKEEARPRSIKIESTERKPRKKLRYVHRIILPPL